MSNRGQDTIVVFENVNNKLKEIQTISTEGTDPRDFALSKDNKFAVATNETSGTITVYAVDRKTGELDVVQCGVEVPEAVCVKFV